MAFSSEETLKKLEAEWKKLVDRAQERRKVFEQKARQNPWVEKLASGELKKDFDARFEELRGRMLDKVGVASKEQIEKLSAKLSKLSKRISDLTNKAA